MRTATRTLSLVLVFGIAATCAVQGAAELPPNDFGQALIPDLVADPSVVAAIVDGAAKIRGK